MKLLFPLIGILTGIFILSLNIFLIYPWFQGQGPVNLGSIEVSYVSMGRFLVDYYPHLSFAPYWYFGFPFHLFYTPILPVLEAVLNQLGHIPLWQAYRFISGAGYVLAPVSLFLFAWVLTKRFVPGVLAGLFYSLLPSLFYFVLPSGEVAADTISRLDGFFDPRRLVIMARWGEGPHTFSLAFLPLAGLFYLLLLENKKRRYLFLFAFFAGLTALTNAVGFYALILLLMAVFFGHWVKQTQAFNQLVRQSFLALAVTYGLIAFWYNLSFFKTFFSEGGGVLQNYLNMLPWGLVGMGLGLAGLFFFFQKVVKQKSLIIASFWFLALFLIVYVYYTSAPPEISEQRLEFAPQALRLMTEADMALAVLLAAIFGAFISFLEKKIKFGKTLGNSLGLLVILGLVIYGYSYLPYGQKAVSGEVDLTKTGEYEVASWLTKNTNVKKGERVYTAGNYGFYLNWFSDVWQLRGGLYQAKTHYWPEHIFYQVNHGTNPEIALDWLKISNIKYLVVNTVASRELYKDYEVPDKFLDLPEVYNEGGDIIYQIPLKDSSPAKLVDLKFLEKYKVPKKADDKMPIQSYANWLDQSQPVDFEVINNDTFKLKGRINPGQAILVQMTYDRGFQASSGKGSVKISKDPLGFMILTSGQTGDFEITLSHGKTWDVWLGFLITVGTLVCLSFAFYKTRKNENSK
ncbi:MAG: hypothetical protein Q8Q24_00130 [bacterium]|nr:hypothetical protein [bacterium]